MEYKQDEIKESLAVKITAVENGAVLGRVFLYVLKNDLHKEPFGFLEDLYVEEEYRKKGIGSKLVELAIEEAKKRGCYKLIGNSRQFAGGIHNFYENMGFQKWGFEFRINLK